MFHGESYLGVFVSIHMMTAAMACMTLQVQDASLLAQYEQLLTAEEHSHMMAAATPELRKERLLARVLVRTTLSRCPLWLAAQS